ncbi:MAG TPA: protein translocase subunit SecD, partial [Chromatiales bacterium]|nr:protein translocase subunit SecD [Chromatiales bacterium]
MNRYPLWKNLLIVAVLVLGLLYALPNIYGEDPAVQVSARSAVVGEADLARVEQALAAAGITPKRVELKGEQLLVRFNDTETQLKAADLVRNELGRGYIVALNLAPNTPAWLGALAAKPMYLGLDLRGGVHFLMEIDMDAALNTLRERTVEDLRGFMRGEKLRYLTVGLEGEDVLVRFADATERAAAEKAFARQYPDLELSMREEGKDFFLVARFGEKAVLAERKAALEQNITTLRNRVNELGVAEPVIQQQGDDR